MKISVIVPFWNSEEWLGRCLESLTTQQGNFDFILVDDKSTDNSREIAYEYCYRDPRFLLMNNHRTKGVSGARNTGLEYAVRSGDWITFLDADDEYLPDAYQSFCLAKAGDSRANIHQLNHIRYYTKTDKIGVKYANKGGVYRFGNLPEAHWAVWNKLYKAEFLEDIRFKEGMQYGEDELFSLTCICKDNYIHHADYHTIVLKRRFDNKKSLSYSKTSDGVINAIREFENLLNEQTDNVIRADLATIIGDQWIGAMTRLLKEGK